MRKNLTVGKALWKKENVIKNIALAIVKSYNATPPHPACLADTPSEILIRVIRGFFVRELH